MTDNQRGSLFMAVSMAGFAIEDLFLKSAARQMPLGQVLLAMGLVGVGWFAAFSMQRGDAPIPRAALSRMMLIRSGFELLGRMFYALALALTPLSVASAILQATPLVVVLGAALLLSEKVSLKRWLVTFLGFGGVLIVVRPGVAGFDALSLLAVVGLIGFAGRDLATRVAPPALSNAQLGLAGFAVLAISGAIMLAYTGDAKLPDLRDAGLLTGAAVFGIAGYSFLTRAMRTGDVSAVTPFRYTRLLFALILGVTFLGERPDAATLIGSGIIVMCGLLILTKRA